MVALGASNIATGLFGGFTTDASLSQTATAESAGAKSQVSSLVTSGLILATALLLAPLFQNLPNAVLGAIVITGVLSLIDVAEIRRYWVWRRTDFLLAMAAMIGVLLTTVLIGMVIAVALSIAFVLYRASRPHVAALGRIPGYRATYADQGRHPEARPVPGLLIIRLDAPLYFFNANVAKKQIEELVETGGSDVHGVLLDLAATADLDVTTTDMMFELVRELHGRSIEVLLAQVKGSVRDRMRRTGLMDEVTEDRVYLSIGSAVIDFQHRWPDGNAAPAADASPLEPRASGPAGGERLP
jgi:MFS superfamily sulfate permease-like transporter